MTRRQPRHKRFAASIYSRDRSGLEHLLSVVFRSFDQTRLHADKAHLIKSLANRGVRTKRRPHSQVVKPLRENNAPVIAFCNRGV